MQRVVGYVRAVDGISFKIQRGKTMGLVGDRAAARRPPARPSCG